MEFCNYQYCVCFVCLCTYMVQFSVEILNNPLGMNYLLRNVLQSLIHWSNLVFCYNCEIVFFVIRVNNHGGR